MEDVNSKMDLQKTDLPQQKSPLASQNSEKKMKSYNYGEYM